MSDEQLRRRFRRAVLAAVFLSLAIPVSFLVLLILTFRGSDQQFAGARLYLGEAFLILGGMAAMVAGLRVRRVIRRHPPVPASAEQRLRAGQAIRSGKLPADGDVELARALAERTVRIYRAQSVAVATVPLMVVAVAIMFRGRTFDTVVIAYAILGWAAVVAPLLAVRRASRFLAATSDR